SLRTVSDMLNRRLCSFSLLMSMSTPLAKRAPLAAREVLNSRRTHRVLPWRWIFSSKQKTWSSSKACRICVSRAVLLLSCRILSRFCGLFLIVLADIPTICVNTLFRYSNRYCPRFNFTQRKHPNGQVLEFISVMLAGMLIDALFLCTQAKKTTAQDGKTVLQQCAEHQNGG